eukprot:244096-Rhodomonas_salina.1
MKPELGCMQNWQPRRVLLKRVAGAVAPAPTCVVCAVVLEACVQAVAARSALFARFCTEEPCAPPSLFQWASEKAEAGNAGPVAPDGRLLKSCGLEPEVVAQSGGEAVNVPWAG